MQSQKISVSVEASSPRELMAEVGIALNRLRSRPDCFADEAKLRLAAQALCHIAIEDGDLLTLAEEKCKLAAQLATPTLCFVVDSLLRE